MATVPPGTDCFNSAMAAGGDLDTSEVLAGMQKIQDYKERLQASGDSTGLKDKLNAFAAREAERTKIAAAMAKRHAALNIIAKDQVKTAIAAHMRAGMMPGDAITAVLEGAYGRFSGMEGGRVSVAAQIMAYQKQYMAASFGRIFSERPHLQMALSDPRLDADITREMGELREGGKPGMTGNDDAKFVARIFAEAEEMMRSESNRLGASIGKLDGRAGPQTHDNLLMIKAGKDSWVDYVLPENGPALLDLARTFPDLTKAEARLALGDIFDTITTGISNTAPAPRAPGRVNPANMAKSLGKSRVLHFKDADAALTYRGKFGYGNTVSAMLNQVSRAARLNGNMERLGPNPEHMINSIAEDLSRDIRDSKTIQPGDKEHMLRNLSYKGGQVGGSIRHALDIATGMIDTPDSVTMAEISKGIRTVKRMAALGGATITSVSDVTTVATSAVFRGSNFFSALVNQFDGLRKSRSEGEFRELNYLLGEVGDGTIGRLSAAVAEDGPLGMFARAENMFFKLNGQTWWTDKMRAGAARGISSEMGMRARTGFEKLPPNYRHVLGLHGIDKERWEIIRTLGGRTIEGKAYITPELVRELSDDVIEPLIQSRVSQERARMRPDDAESVARTAINVATIIDGERRRLELTLGRFFADEMAYGMLEPDARTRRTTTWGTRPGTMAGEAIRFVMQFKAFPAAYTHRVLGRALYGHRKGAGLAERLPHLGAMLAGMTMAGYLSMTAKDMLKGYWPPRDPSDWKVLSAAFVQGGAAGIYGDFLFGEVNRFGGGLLTTAAGPTIGSAFEGITLVNSAIRIAGGAVTGEESKIPAGDALNLVLANTPFANLFYTRPALDYLFLNSLREAVSPGYLKRQRTNRLKDYNQGRSGLQDVAANAGILPDIARGDEAFGRN